MKHQFLIDYQISQLPTMLADFLGAIFSRETGRSKGT